MREITTGKILKDQKVTGTGFLVAENIVVTAKHNVLAAEDIVDDSTIHEQEIWFLITEDDPVRGKTMNLREAEKRGVDCVFIRLEEKLSERPITVLTEAENDITGDFCKISGSFNAACVRKTFSELVGKSGTGSKGIPCMPR